MTIASPIGPHIAACGEEDELFRDPTMREELGRIVADLGRLLEVGPSHRSAFAFAADAKTKFAPNALAGLAEVVLRLRSQREKFIPGILSGEPDWNILLHLYIEAQRLRAVSIKSACIASGVPEATALRYIELLVGRGQLHRDGDPLDKRRKYLSLTATGQRHVHEALLHAFTTLRRFYGGEAIDRGSAG